MTRATLSVKTTAGRHLGSEDPVTESIEVVRAWIDAYTELIEFEKSLLSRLYEMLPIMSAEARHEAEMTDLAMVVQHLQTFQYRRAHWRQQLQALNGQ